MDLDSRAIAAGTGIPLLQKLGRPWIICAHFNLHLTQADSASYNESP